MERLLIHLTKGVDGGVVVAATRDGQQWRQRVEPNAFGHVRDAVDRLLEGFETGQRPRADPVALLQLGGLLGDTFLGPIHADALAPFAQTEGGLCSTFTEAFGCSKEPSPEHRVAQR